MLYGKLCCRLSCSGLTCRDASASKKLNCYRYLVACKELGPVTCRSKSEKKADQGDMRAQAGLTAPDSQPRPILPQKPASDYQIHYIIRVLLLQNLPPLHIVGKHDFATENRSFLEYFPNLSGEFFQSRKRNRKSLVRLTERVDPPPPSRLGVL